MSDLHMSELDVFLRAGCENCDKMKYPGIIGFSMIWNWGNSMKLHQNFNVEARYQKCDKVTDPCKESFWRQCHLISQKILTCFTKSRKNFKNKYETITFCVLSYLYCANQCNQR